MFFILISGWEQCYDASTGKTFYKEHVNKATSWTVPMAPVTVPEILAPVPTLFMPGQTVTVAPSTLFMPSSGNVVDSTTVSAVSSLSMPTGSLYGLAEGVSAMQTLPIQPTQPVTIAVVPSVLPASSIRQTSAMLPAGT